MKNLEELFEENNLDLETVNVDFEMSMIEACMNEEESFMFEGDEYEVTVDYSDAESVWGTTTEALTNAQRRKKAVQMKKGKASRLRKKKIAEKKLSSPDKIKSKSNKKARKIIEKKLLNGKDKSELSYSQRAALEKKVDKKKGAISRIAKRVKKDVKKADRERVKSRRSPKNEDVQYDEAAKFKFSSGYKATENAINHLTSSLTVGSNLNRAVDRDLEGSYKPEFNKMDKLIGDIESIWAEIAQEYKWKYMSEEKSLEQKNTLTKAEYDEVQNFSNFDKKDWKKQGSKYVRIKPVKEDVNFEEATAAQRKLKTSNKLSSEEYEKFSKLKAFNDKDWKWNSKEGLYHRVTEETELEEATAADVKKVLASAKDGGDVKGNTIDFGEGSVIKVTLEKGKIKFDGGKSSGIELFDTAKDAIAALEDTASEGEHFNEDNEYVIVTDKDTKTFPKSRPGLKKAYDAVAKSKIWVIYYVDKNGKQEIVDSSDN